ncbi:E3 ubiquitin-protein ligase TRIM21-like [Tautogolabrus adspersus]
MASSQASPCNTGSLEKHVTCTICMNVFVDPVTTACGHSFCKDCLLNNNDMVCPRCKKPLSRTPDVNIALKNLVEEIKKKIPEKEDEYTGAPGEVACDICTERKLKAKKSCLVCLASYCSTHLQNHSTTQRLKGHKLVQPEQNLDERACLQHGRPLELYSRTKERCICVLCMEEDEEEVVPIEEEWNRKKAELESPKTELQQKVENRKTRMDEINADLKSCEDQLNDECGDIDAVFTALIAIVKEARYRALQPLKDRRKVVEKEAKDIEAKMKAEVDRLEKTISELDDISALEDHILFLQKYPSLQDLDNIKDCPEVELDTSLSFGTMINITTAMLESIQQELEKLTPIEIQRIPKFTVDVRLDPTTAHQHLILSDDGKEVKDGEEDQEVPDSPERFDMFGSVLGLNRLTYGKSYWEVEVGNKTGWDLGVARRDANRKGKLTLTPDNGYWVTVHYEDDKYAALTAPPAHLSLKEKPQKVGVFVDYEEGLVSFYDVASKSHIYSFTDCSFNGKIFPYFSPHLKDEENMDPLIISSV